MRIIRPLVRKATKVVVYPLMPVVPITKSLTVGTRRSNQSRAEIKKQTGLIEDQNRLLSQQIEQSERQAQRGSSETGGMTTPDGRWVSYDGGETYQPSAQQQAVNSARFAVACAHVIRVS